MNNSLPLLRGRVAGEAACLCLLAAVIGIVINFSTIYAAFTGTSQEVKRPEVATTDAVTDSFDPFPVALEELDDFIAEGAVFVDSRSTEDYVSGHISGAVSFPLAEFEQQIDRYRAQWQLEQTLIIYCSGYGCPDSRHLGIKLMRQGFADVLVYEGGFPEWRDVGRPVERGEP